MEEQYQQREQFIKKRGKKIIQEIKEKRLRAITLQGAIGKIAMFLLGKWKKEQMLMIEKYGILPIFLYITITKPGV